MELPEYLCVGGIHFHSTPGCWLNSILSRDGVKRQSTPNYKILASLGQTALVCWRSFYKSVHALQLADGEPFVYFTSIGTCSGSRVIMRRRLDSPFICRSLCVGTCAERKRAPVHKLRLVEGHARSLSQFVAQHSLTPAVSISTAFSD